MHIYISLCHFSEYSAFDCGFENDVTTSTSCRVQQDSSDQFDWTRNNGRTPSGMWALRTINNVKYPVTGPDQAKVGDYYLYSEASGKAKSSSTW